MIGLTYYHRYAIISQQHRTTEMQKLRAFIAADEKRRQAQESMLCLLVDNVDALMRELFDTHPQLLGMKWTQYTPYFNEDDDEPYQFATDGLFLLLDDFATGDMIHCEGVYWEDDNDGESMWIEWDENVSITCAAITDAHAVFRAFPDDILKKKWGDPVEVRIMREGVLLNVSTSSYEHD